MDIASIVGFAAGWFVIFFAIVIGAGIQGFVSFIDYPSMIVTLGGMLCSTAISVDMGDIKNLLRVFMKAFFTETHNIEALIKQLVKFAEIARRDGILALEGSIRDLDNEFMVMGIQLAVDGTDPELIRETMTTEMEEMQNRHSSGKKMVDLVGKYAPAWGMIGTLMGLVLMLKNLSDVSTIGPNMAVAIITSFYGAVVANLVAGPIGDKLSYRDGEESMVKEIIIRGVMSIQSGDNPRIVEQKLRIFLPPAIRGKIGGKSEGG